jgi:hypothetical protein
MDTEQHKKLFINPLIGEDWDDPDEKTDISDRLSGRIVYVLNGIVEDEITFYCGPETKAGWIDDSYDCGLYEQLEELLSDFDAVAVGSAENFHSIEVRNGVDANKLWEDVKKILENAGAVQWQMPE